MNRIVIIAFAILLSMTALFGYISYHLKGSLAKAEHALVLSENSRLQGEKALLNRDLSCKIDDTSVVEVEKEKKELQSKVDDLDKQIVSLKKGIKKPVTPPKENSQVEEQNEILVGPELIDPALLSLLNKSFCIAEPEDSECLPTGQPADPSL